MTDSTRRLALIGIGSNSTRLLIATRVDGEIRVLGRGERVTRLAGYRIMPDGRALLTEEAIAATLGAATTFAERAHQLGATLSGVVATEAVRAASNSGELTQALEQQLGTPVKILSGEEEARFGWTAVASSSAFLAAGGEETTIGVIDIGGGSTDLSVGYSGHEKPESVLSLNTGGRTVMSRFGLQRVIERTTLMGTMSSLNIEIARRVSALRPAAQAAIVIGGTAAVFAALRSKTAGDGALAGDTLIDGMWLDLQLKKLSLIDVAGRVAMGVPEDRADVIVAGAAILLIVLQAWGLTECYASERNILDGYIQLIL